MNKNNAFIIFLAGVIGNVLDHYDTAIYGFLSPYLAPLFFPFEDKAISQIAAYGLLSTSYMRPFGTLFFSYLAYKIGSRNTLAITLIGVASSTALIGFIPGYNNIGIISPILLAILRVSQGFFAAGEYVVSAFFIFNYAKHGKYAQANSYYLISTMGGITLASTAAMIVSSSRNPSFYWRHAFIIGIVTGIVGLILRLVVVEEKQVENKSEAYKLVENSRYYNSFKVFKVICITSFSYITYFVPFLFLNIFVPLVNINITNQEMLKHNNILMIINIILLPIMGYIGDKFNYRRWMIGITVIWALTIVPSLLILPNLSLIEISMVKFWIILLGVSMSPVTNAWIFQQLHGSSKYLIIGISYILGTEILGRNSNFICLSLWKYFDSIMAPAFYILCITMLTIAVLVIDKERKQ